MLSNSPVIHSKKNNIKSKEASTFSSIEVNTNENIYEIVSFAFILAISTLFILTNNLDSNSRLNITHMCLVAFLIFFILQRLVLKVKFEIYKQFLIIFGFLVVFMQYLLFFVYYEFDINDFNDSSFLYYILKFFELIWEFQLYNSNGNAITVMCIIHCMIGLVAILDMFNGLEQIMNKYALVVILVALILYVTVISYFYFL